MKKYIYSILLILGISCSKEEMTVYKGYIKNTTAHEIKILPYFNGTIRNTKVITLMDGDSIQIASGYDRGIVNHGGFNSEYLDGDSIVVVFDNQYSISHYVITPSSLNSKHYLYSSLRNLGNYLGWDYSADDVSRLRREALYIYKFIEQDYLDAKL